MPLYFGSGCNAASVGKSHPGLGFTGLAVGWGRMGVGQGCRGRKGGPESGVSGAIKEVVGEGWHNGSERLLSVRNAVGVVSRLLMHPGGGGGGAVFFLLEKRCMRQLQSGSLADINNTEVSLGAAELYGVRVVCRRKTSPHNDQCVLCPHRRPRPTAHPAGPRTCGAIRPWWHRRCSQAGTHFAVPRPAPKPTTKGSKKKHVQTFKMPDKEGLYCRECNT